MAARKSPPAERARAPVATATSDQRESDVKDILRSIHFTSSDRKAVMAFNSRSRTDDAPEHTPRSDAARPPPVAWFAVRRAGFIDRLHGVERAVPAHPPAQVYAAWLFEHPSHLVNVVEPG
ncbi:hypothetical protein GCM10023322_33490 [Rugosimonospora acidiphila]|uniref:Uncharacterized protein n=1 Tax=Rugosimonospora acidiphila TaxID=556531 RepID=A0ABP9RT60_9ACTN